ncbi:MAG TPA: hypothetical protein VFE64_12910, partial [Devosia sp.]|nr:hypothetical protein [Devosia sp.]
MTLVAILACLLPLLVGGTFLLRTPIRPSSDAARLATVLAGISFAAALLCAGLVVVTCPSSLAVWHLSLTLDPVGAVF